MMNIKKVPAGELKSRMDRFLHLLDKGNPDWELCVISGGINIYYFTGTICDGALFIRRGADSVLWVKRSFERAILESEFPVIRNMSSFADVTRSAGRLPETVYLDMSAATMEWYGILNKHCGFSRVLPIDRLLLNARSVKSQYEIDIMTRAGGIIYRLLTEELPRLLRPGMSEAELGADLFSLFVKNGYQGLSRFSMRNTEVALGHVCFSESVLYPSVFNGASGIIGLSPAAPVLGSRDQRLKEGDLIFADFGFGFEGYHADRTIIYSFKRRQPEHVMDAHKHCLEIERRAASMLIAGSKPSDIYTNALDRLKPELSACFMGVNGRTVPFLGHGVGLYINEYPVIAKGFDDPLECGMTIALEPKIGIKGVGMVGSENTYLITESGAESLTGEARDIIVID